MTAASRSHFANTSRTASSWPAFATISMRSCDSESSISYGVMPSSRSGTASSSRTIPAPPRPAISSELDVSPAAPMSWMATM